MKRWFRPSSCPRTGTKGRRPAWNKAGRRLAVCRPAAELLEARCYLAGDPIVTVDTNFGNFQIELRPDAAPKTVANFLQYVESGAYTDSIFHRSVPGSVEQAGGFTSTSTTFTSTSQFSAIPINAPVPLEYNLPNIAGSVAMARTSDPNSATDEWFVNLTDNSQTFAPGGVDPNGFAVFGQVIGNGMQVLNAIAALPVDDADNGGVFGQLPLGPNNELVQISSVTVESIDGEVFSDTNDNGTLDSGEPGIPGRTVFLNNDGTGAPDASNPSTTTDANGNYIFGGLAAGTYDVMEVVPSGVTLTTSTQAVTVAAGQTTTANLGELAEKLQFSAATYNANETDGSATITLTRTGGSSGAVAVMVSTSDGTAKAGTDYTASTQTVSWADGDTANKTISIPLLDDNGTGESAQTVNLALSNASGGATLGTQNTAVLTIAEDDDVASPPPVTYVNGQAGDNTVVRFVQNLYRELLGRDADTAGLTFFVGVYSQAITSGTPADAQHAVIADFLVSTEYQQHLVEGIYQNFLHRSPEAGGLQAWTGALAGGQDEKNVLAEIIGSDEYFADAGGTNVGFVAALYHDVLGRDADPGGASSWLDLLTSPPPFLLSFLSSNNLSGDLRIGVAEMFLSTPEAAHKLLDANFPGAAGGVGAPGTPAVGAYALADITGNGWDNLFFQGTLSNAAVDSILASLQSGAPFDDEIAALLDMPQYFDG